jgi:peptidoglycan/LPS O-acetylase OafA/YrhL
MHYPALDGLRGIAILAVIFRHNFDFLQITKYGWIGVDLFFVLSGFLITDILLKTKTQKNYLANFFIRRILRIFPLYYGAIILFFVLAASAELLRDQYNFYFTNQGMVWFHLQNWLYITKSEPTHYGMFIHFWSLSLEEQFYLVWPFVMLACKQMRHLASLTIVILLASIVFRFVSWASLENGDLNHYLQHMVRIDGLCVGSLVAIWKASSAETAKKKIFQLGAILLFLHAIVFLLSKLVFKPFPHFSILGYSSIAVLFGMLLTILLEKRNRLTKMIFENKLLVGVGKISYGLYVFHWPILVLFRIYFLQYLMEKGVALNLSYTMASLFATFAAILVSIASYHLMEKKILALKDVFTSDRFIKRILIQYRSVFGRLTRRRPAFFQEST